MSINSRFIFGSEEMKKKVEFKSWDKVWEETEEMPLFRRISYDFIKKRLAKVLEEIKLPKNAKIIDVACGSGTTLKFFRELNYLNSIGIDISHNSIILCKKLFGYQEGKDVFRMDASKTTFARKFDLVFSNGLLEHFRDFSHFAKEMCRISKKYIIIFQPDPTSFIGRIIRGMIMNGIIFHGEQEYFFELKDYEKTFSKFGFRLVSDYRYGLGGICILFERIKK